MLFPSSSSTKPWEQPGNKGYWLLAWFYFTFSHNSRIIKGGALLHKFQACFSQNCLSCFNMAGVIGSLDLGRVARCFVCLSLIPFSVHSSSGHAATNGSPMPDTTCIFLIADRYPLIDECFKPSSARWATYRHNWSSLNGSGLPTKRQVSFLTWRVNSCHGRSYRGNDKVSYPLIPTD